MLRGLIFLLLIAGAALLAAPFFLSSLAIDEHGATIPGRVYSKSETVTVHNSQWQRSSEVTFRYDPPDSSTTGFFGVTLAPEEYDRFRIGQSVSLHYLRREDVPAVPLASILHQMHVLPVVRLAERRTFTTVQQFFTGNLISGLEVVAGLVIGLLILRKSGSPLFKWVLGGAVLAGIGVLMIYDFPRPTPKPATDVRRTTATVKSVDRIDRVFEGKRSRGFVMDQPVDVVGLEFVPSPGVEPVVAVDLIDAGSISGLTIHSTVPIEYEAAVPRTARILPGTREFVSRNIRGMAAECALTLAVLIGFFAAAQWIARAFNRLVARNQPQ